MFVSFVVQNELDKALEFARKALAIDLKVHDDSHPDVAGDYNTIASILQDKVRV